MKKLISRRNFLKVCALAGSAAALSACGGGKSTGSSNSAAAAVDTTGAVEFPLSEKVTFTGMTSFPVGSEPEPNNRTIFKRLEEQTNVHIDWTAIQSDQWSDKITLNMSNPNTLTDFVFTADFTDSNLLRYADQGVILNLEDYIDNNMPNLQKVFEQYPEYRTICTDIEGHIWPLPWIEQLGAEKTAIQTIGNMSFINTKWLNFLGLSMPTTVDALVKYMLEKNPDICETTGSVNPVVCECNDCGLNDIRGLHVTEQHVFAALADCKADFAEGAVGAGRGMRCHGLKGGIGSASRVVELDGKPYTMGALVLSNHALFDDLIVAGTPIHTLLNNSIPPHEDKGSIITVLATDIPLSERQLRRLCRRALVGLSRTGSYCGNGSGEIVIAFTTANRVPHYSEKALLPMTLLHDDAINPLFRAVAECVEESVLSSLLHAETVTGNHGQTFRSLTELLKKRA